MANKRYDVLSPDGFGLFRERTFSSPEKAKEGFEEWKKGYEAQGYYSYRGQRIPLNELESYCELVEL